MQPTTHESTSHVQGPQIKREMTRTGSTPIPKYMALLITCAYVYDLIHSDNLCWWWLSHFTAHVGAYIKQRQPNGPCVTSRTHKKRYEVKASVRFAFGPSHSRPGCAALVANALVQCHVTIADNHGHTSAQANGAIVAIKPLRSLKTVAVQWPEYVVAPAW